ncbi:Na(+)/H(+) antiporter subunit B [Desulforamulus ferrireducens]|uniref:Na(+)/H(+) antiporter subunit B n=1 Tax=Desulforamulus ferrireducens TaxID=1833852 RepID=A0A1S6IW54_9FIRM|nr:Na(+)/H(+) antiporter subunit B [Desulforamulus ferrireducens]AQS58989.1 Na(+)/H(+) antiporter subunit B [Desulforamulus ferrireducens]
MKPNDVILQTVTKVVTFIILTFAVYLFLAGHHEPGGGFIGGLVITSGLTLLYLAFDIESVRQGVPVDFKIVAAVGVFIAVATGMGSLLFDSPFLSQTYGYYNLPIFGETELATAVLFDLGVALAVVGTGVTIILSISGDA